LQIPACGAVAVSRVSKVNLSNVVFTRFIRVIHKVCKALDTPVKPGYDDHCVIRDRNDHEFGLIPGKQIDHQKFPLLIFLDHLLY
jgi:hypothetical protein